jgi:hypothetical protein
MSDHNLNPLRDPKKEIVMRAVKGTNKLNECYFYPTDVKGVYLLSTRQDQTLAVVTDGQPFMFQHDGLVWKVPNPLLGSEPFSINHELARGSFWNNGVGFEQGEGWEEGGTFTAQASGGVEDANAASAGAY